MQNCGHVAELRERFSGFRRLAEPKVDPKNLPPIIRNDRALELELPFRDDQILVRGEERKPDCNAVIQRLNDVFGVHHWVFELVGNPIELRGEIMVLGKLRLPAISSPAQRQDYGYAKFYGSRLKAQAYQAAVDDCLLRWARQLGIGLEVYSGGDSHRSFSHLRLCTRTGKLLGPDDDDPQDRVANSKA